MNLLEEIRDALTAEEACYKLSSGSATRRTHEIFGGLAVKIAAENNLKYGPQVREKPPGQRLGVSYRRLAGLQRLRIYF